MNETKSSFVEKLNINHKVFWPPFCLFLFATVYSYMDNNGMIGILKAAHGWVSGAFGWAMRVLIVQTN